MRHPITKAKGTVTSTGTTPGTCAGLLTPGTTPFTATVKWKAIGASLNPSTITFANIGSGGFGFDLPAGGCGSRAPP